MTNNFKYLNNKLPELAVLADFAEQYVYPDPASAAVKLRLFSEKLAAILFQIFNIKPELEKTFYEQLEISNFKRLLPKSILNLIHYLRIKGNKAAHSSEINSPIALDMLNKAYELSKWLYISYLNGNEEDIPEFEQPPKIDESKEWQKERFEIIEKLYQKENQVKDMLVDLERERIKSEELKKSKDELGNLFNRSVKVADELKFTEEYTRQLLIDEALGATGWNVGKNGLSTEEVQQEFEVDNQPTHSGIGYADYVLFDDNGKPLAVIEAKKTSKDANAGKKQATLYADSLEKRFQQRPIIFYTNGYDIYLWNDIQNEPPRKIYGFYSKDSLQYLIFQRINKLKAEEIVPDPNIAGRLYQMESIKRVIEKFDTKHRKALIVQATGTGKTRVAVSICDSLSRANWVKRILFLCDRRELRKQAKNVFTEFLSGEPLTIVTASTAKDREQRIYLATYPAMIQNYQNFDVGFFDLIIADESHRSIYKVYRDIFEYFDCYQIGLTATPVNYINRNTFRLFECGDSDPTAYFSYDDAINSEPPYLVPFEVFNVTTEFLRKGIKYSQMNREQQEELEDQVPEPETIDFDPNEVDRFIFNKDTNRKILRNLMENGIKLNDGSLGKTIIFARNHRHAVALQGLFDEMYQNYGGRFCQVLDSYDPRADQLIDDLKSIGTNPYLTIAISVDMLDTGIDIPELVNLVFAKPIKSYVKFWQMIGRGTRLRENLFGRGENKTKFRIFDHWGNFEWFDLNPQIADPTLSKSLMQRLFEERIILADNSLKEFDRESFSIAVDLITNDLSTLASTQSISVKEHFKEIKSLQRENVIENFSGEIKNLLINTIAPLMQWINIRGDSAAYFFDLLIAETQNAVLSNTGRLQDYNGKIQNQLNGLKKNLNQVKAKSEVIKEALSDEFWKYVNVIDLEKIRKELRSIMKYKEGADIEQIPVPVIDVSDSDVEYDKYPVKSTGMEMAEYKKRVEDVLQRLINESNTLQKIKAGKKVNESDLKELLSLVLTQHPDLDLEILNDFYPETAGHLDLAIRHIIGLDPKFIDESFSRVVHDNPQLNSTQIKFLDMLKQHIAKYGSMQLEKLYEPPFTTIHTESVYGVFPDEHQANQIINIVREINYPYQQPSVEE